MAVAMKADGFKVTPNTMDQWETAYPSEPRSIGRPISTAFLSPSEWMQPIVPVVDHDELEEFRRAVTMGFLAECRILLSAE